MKRIIVNGANGYVASNFIDQLLKENYEVVALVRPSKKQLPKERMLEVLNAINDDRPVNTSKLKVYSYNLLEDDFSIPIDVLQDIYRGKVDYFHFAASLKYDLKSRDEIFSTNINGVENSIKVYKKYASSDSRFFFVGTAYSCGNYDGRFEEKFHDNQEIEHFRNYYEQSKRYAENIVRKEVEENGMNAHIIRPSQVVGNNKTGVTKTDYGVFDFSKRVFNLAMRNPNQLVRLQVDGNSTQNLIPIDTIVSYFMRTVAMEEVPRIMNFIAKKAVRNSEVIGKLNEMLPIEIQAVENLDKDQMTPLERIMSIGMSFTGSYLDVNISFDTSNLDAMMNSADKEPETVNVGSMLDYFITQMIDKKEKNALKAVS